MIFIGDLDKAKVLFALYNYSRHQGLGWLSKRDEVTIDTCREIINPWHVVDSKEALEDKLVGMLGKKSITSSRKNHVSDLLDRLGKTKTEDEFLELLAECEETFPNTHLYFDYLYGKVMKVDLSGSSFDERLYDRDNGEGAAVRAVESIRR